MICSTTLILFCGDLGEELTSTISYKHHLNERWIPSVYFILFYNHNNDDDNNYNNNNPVLFMSY